MTKILNFLNDFHHSVEDQPTEVDLTILNRLSEFPFERVVTSDQLPLRVHSACLLLLDYVEKQAIAAAPNNLQLLRQVVDSNRYKNVMLSRIISGSDGFLALTFDLTKNTKVLSFRGPSGTLISWQKDCQFITQELTDIVISAREYLDFELEHDTKNIFAVGFSSGASLVALAFLNHELPEDREIEALLLNSAGLPLSFNFDMKIRELISPMAIFSLIGEHPFPQIAVESSTAGIWQHDPFSWVIDSDGNFKRSVSINFPADSSKHFMQLIPKNMNKDQLRHALNLTFEMFSVLPYEQVSDVIKYWTKFNHQVKNSIADEEPMVQLFINHLMESIFNNAAVNLQKSTLK